MIFHTRTLFSCILISLWSLLIFSAECRERKILMGPLLLFKGADNQQNTWSISALYLLEQSKTGHPVLSFYDEGKREASLGKVIGSLFDYDFVRYDIIIHRSDKRLKIEYNLDGEKKSHAFFVPAIGQSAHILYHSCNGQQSEKDRQKVGGIAPMWKEINRRHQEEPFVLQLGGGDQLYADGLVNKQGEGSLEPSQGKTFGVFALPTILSWLHDKKNLASAQFTSEMAQEVTKFYFDHYVRQYTSEEFSTTMASVPSLAQPDDHDFYDGCGSYPSYLQNSPVMSGIRAIGSWFAFTIQHQLDYNGVQEDELSKIKTHSFLHIIDEGKLAILGIDTRSERSEDQVVSKNTWSKIFADLEMLEPKTQHLIVMLAIPVIYASTKMLDKTFELAHCVKPLDKAASMIPNAKNAFGLFELADDCRDAWGHKAHKHERNVLIARLQQVALKKNIRVTIISGDVHLGGVGKIYPKNIGIEDCSEKAIWQIISSPVGNITVGKKTTKLLNQSLSQEKSIKNQCGMCLFKLHEDEEEKRAKGTLLIRKRNFVALNLLPDDYLHVSWSAESRKDKSHKLYKLSIPPAPRAKAIDQK